MFEKNLNVSLTTPQKKRKYPIYPELPGNTQEYPELPDNKKDTRKYPIIYFNTPTRPEPDPLPGIFSNTRPDIEKPYPLGTEHKGQKSKLLQTYQNLCEKPRNKVLAQSGLPDKRTYFINIVEM